MLNIEALYATLVTCVNTALETIYADKNPQAIACTTAAETMAPCIGHWILNVIPQCPAANMYLEDILTGINSTNTFDFCSHPQRCTDGAAGAHAVCEVVNAAMPLTNGATLSPMFTFPPPANKLPTFTIPTNTAGPTTTTTAAPTPPSIPTTTTTTTAHPTTTTTAHPATTTTAHPTTSTHNGST